MAKPKVSLASMVAAEASRVAPLDVVTLQRPDVIASRPKASHTSLYLSPAVLKAIRQIALDLDRRPHDLLVEGVDLMLAKYGRPSIAEIDRK